MMQFGYTAVIRDVVIVVIGARIIPRYGVCSWSFFYSVLMIPKAQLVQFNEQEEQTKRI